MTETTPPKQELAVAVRDLVAFVRSAGDLEPSAFGGSTRQLDAIRAHQSIQRSRPPEYTSEVTVSRRIETERIILDIRGRIDGVYRWPDRAVIDEIKTTTGDPEEAAKSENPLHWAQAMCYAAIYAEDEVLDAIEVQLTYARLPGTETFEIRKQFTRDELIRYFTETVERYIFWAETLGAWRETRNASIAAMQFPCRAYRPGQREFALDVWGTIREGGQLVAQAPTGTGKTLAMLFPAIKALGAGPTEKLFYLTARTTGRAAAEDTIALMRGAGLDLKSLTLTAKERICFTPGAVCSGEECPYAKGYYDRLPDARTAAFALDEWTRETVSELARAHRVCPFEYSLDLSLWADIVIGDYNYAFDPTVYLRRFFAEEGGKYVFLVDEAHNLVDRARDMFSAELSKQPLMELRRAIATALPTVAKHLAAANRHLLAIKKDCGASDTIASPDLPSSLVSSLRHFTAAAERWLVKNEPAPFRDILTERYFDCNAFIRVSEQFDQTYTTLISQNARDVTVKLFCLDPAPQMREALTRCTSAVFFSATLTPMSYFKTILGLSPAAYELAIPTPFPPENRLILLADRISTRYRDRSGTLDDVASLIGAMITGHTGNYLCFFPSYEYLARVHERFTARFPAIETIVQARAMSEDERTAFLARFGHDNPSTLAGFAVMGGIFGEGIDLVGDRLTGAAIVGVGLPGISPERDAIRVYFDKSGMGFDFAYRFPGINRVLQAAGRVIRSETDKGVILLIDERFAMLDYRRLLPEDWKPVRVKEMAEVEKRVRGVWG